MYCSFCGHVIQDGAAFCSSCGAKTEPQQTPRYQASYGDNRAYTPVPPPEVAAAESKAVTSLVLGIIGNIAGFFVVGIILGLFAISEGKKARLVLSNSNHNFWIALAGVITGIVSVVISVIFAIYWTLFIFIIQNLW